MHNIDFSSGKVALSDERCSDQAPFTSKNCSKQRHCNMTGQQETEGLFHRRKLYYGLWTCILDKSDSVKLKWLNGV